MNNITSTQSATPYIIQLGEPLNTIKLNEGLSSLGLKLGTLYSSESQQIIFNSPQDPIKLVQDLNQVQTHNGAQILLQSFENQVEFVQEVSQNNETVITIDNDNEENCHYQIIYPEDLNLKRKPMKRGRPRKSVIDKPPKRAKTPTKGSRTRSGRLVKLPKHMEKDFKRIELSDNDEIKTTNFKRFEEDKNSKTEFVSLELITKKRTINNQYKCPRCLKAYLGKSKMISHLVKHPDHGPLPEYNRNDNNNVWNSLIDTTKKSQTGRRGAVFCRELTNLLNNLQLMKRALFKKVTDNKNVVEIDQALGNAIGLTPDNEIFKNVKTNNQNLSDLTTTINNDITRNDNNIIDKVLEHPHYVNKIEEQSLDNRIGLQSDILSDNLLLNLPIMSGVGSNLLDSSASSDEVMNVDQFVNERFKKITESDVEMVGSSLNLDLPSMELFQFNTS